MAAAGAMATTRWLGLMVSLVVAAACTKSQLKLIEPGEPKQQGKENPMKARGARGFDQRQQDCWDMPSAQACYEVGLNYELGLAVKANRATALEYYDKACGLEKHPDHCQAAERLRHEP
ncbi:MAG: SEL1-like repeat protein [Deltaproteobacteria bacterium]|nr:SEL1-like repeat protein [Deltaproteobacteria bacterium]